MRPEHPVLRCRLNPVAVAAILVLEAMPTRLRSKRWEYSCDVTCGDKLPAAAGARMFATRYSVKNGVS
jgi:hypothetical protein